MTSPTNSSPINRRLGFLPLAALIVSAHYGMGFLMGTAEQAQILGAAGSLYAVSVGLGVLALLLLAKFYWTGVEQLWVLLGDRYGRSVLVLVGVMSWASLIGVEAAQIVSGSAILSVLGLPTAAGMVSLTLLFLLMSLLPVEKASWLVQGLLVVNVLSLLWGLVALHGGDVYGRSPLEFWPALHQVRLTELIGVSVSTILVVLIDVKHLQFVVEAKTLRSLRWGCVLAALLLTAMAFLPTAEVLAAQRSGVLPPDLPGREIIPYVLAWLGGGADHLSGQLLLISLVVPALGVGSSILRVQTRTLMDFEVLPPARWSQGLFSVTNALLGLAIALKGGSLVGLIVQFYSAYVAAAWVPFGAYLLAEKGYFLFSNRSVRIALTCSTIASLSTLITTLIQPDWVLGGSAELDIMIVGLGCGLTGLLGCEVLERNCSFSLSISTRPEKEL